MSINQSNECPLCNQFVPNETRFITTKNGKRYHEGCAKEIAEAYLTLTMKSDNAKKPKKDKKNTKPQRTPQKKKESNDSQANISA